MRREQVAEHDNLVVEAYADVRINTDIRLSKLKVKADKHVIHCIQYSTHRS